MFKGFVLIASAALLAGCSGENAAENNGAAAATKAAAEKPKRKYCFFKDHEMKGWKASRGKDGNVVVTGKAYRSDSRYKAILGEALVSGETAEISPSIVPNDSAYGAPGDWWDVSATIPDSGSVTTVQVTCGKKTPATLSVPRAK